MANDTMTQEERLSRDFQQNQNDNGLNDGLTDEQGDNVGVVGLPSSGNDCGTGLGTGGYSSSAVMDDQEFEDAMRRSGDDVTDTTAPDYGFNRAGVSSGAG